MSAVERCRTAALGGHVDECGNCGHLRISYNSCRNRHCPKCQSMAKEKWLLARKKDLLPVKYFHIVFTIPDEINPIALINQKEIYELLFKSASATLLELAKDAKYLGAEIGLIAILHTWGQNLTEHPHIHCLVPGGGLALDGQKWFSTREDFFLPVKVMSRLFRGKFLDAFKKKYRSKKLKCVGNLESLEKGQEFQKLLDKLYQKEWIVYCKPPFGNAEQVLEYLGRYTHRVAITNNRIVSIKEGKISFRWKDYKDGNRKKVMTVEATEFIRRFLLHVLPDNFVKIRHYGMLSNRNRKTKIQQCRSLLGQSIGEAENSSKEAAWEDVFLSLTGIDIRICPCCGIGKMLRKEIIHPRNYVPPERRKQVA